MTENTANPLVRHDQLPHSTVRRPAIHHAAALVSLVLLLLALTGCSSILSPISGVPAHRLPPQFLAPPKNNLVPIDISRLRQEPPAAYLVDAGDVLAVYIPNPESNQIFPVPLTPATSQGESQYVSTSMGGKVFVREDGTISLPNVPSINVKGLTIPQVEEKVRNALEGYLANGKDQITVVLDTPRKYLIIVSRQDGIRGGSGSETSGVSMPRTGEVVELVAYENDVLHALAKTGGLPGVEARNEIKILRSSALDANRRDAFVREFYQHQPCDPCLCLPPIPDDPAIIRIPLRLPPGVPPPFHPADIILQEGDIVMIEGRDREVFYTGGLLGGGVHALPRDYDLDVVGAMAVVGQGVASQSGGGRGRGGGGGGGGFGGGGQGSWGVPPGQLFIIRKTPCGDQITIDVDLNRAIRDPKARPLIQPEDILVLQYRPQEEILNFGIAVFFTELLGRAIGRR